MPSPLEKVPLYKQLAGLFFGVICISGLIAALFPSKCLLFPRDKGKATGDKVETKNFLFSRFKGHHPQCGKFSFHTLKLGDKVYCAGCFGLAIGALISLFGILMYFFFPFKRGFIFPIMFWLGVIGVTSGLLQHNLFVKRAKIHFSLNVYFVLGTFFLLVGVIELNGNIEIIIYVLTLIIYWIISRIVLSNVEHKKTCVDCNIILCEYR